MQYEVKVKTGYGHRTIKYPFGVGKGKVVSAAELVSELRRGFVNLLDVVSIEFVNPDGEEIRERRKTERKAAASGLTRWELRRNR